MPITELALRSLFTTFGEVKDVSIKKLQYNRQARQQAGYGFIHYPLTDNGITAAFAAVEAMNDKTIEGIYFHCCPSRSLENYLNTVSQMESFPLSTSSSNSITTLSGRSFPVTSSSSSSSAAIPNSIFHGFPTNNAYY